MLIFQIRILFSLFILLITDPSFSNSNDKQTTASPFNWRVIISSKNVENVNVYEGSKINIIKNGFLVNNNKVSCKLEFNSEWDKNSSGIMKGIGPVYNERLWLTCKIGDTEIAPSATSCSKAKDLRNSKSMDMKSITIGSSNIQILCELSE